MKTSSGVRRTVLAVYAIITDVVVVAAMTVSVKKATAAPDITANLTLIAPAGPGGGWDGFVREQQQAMRSAGLVGNAQVVNIPGAGGTIGLGRFTTMGDRSDTLLATGSAMTGGILINDSPVGYEDVRPIAKIAEDYDVVIVPADSPVESIDDLLAEWSEDPKGHPWTGGSAGSLDHLVVAELALAGGLDASEITFIPKSGGGEAIQALLNGTADYAATGYNEVSDQIEAGRVRAVGVTGPERIEGTDIPTIIEQGHDVELSNWRGMLATGDVPEEEFQQQLDLLTQMRETPEWQDALERNAWADAWETGDDLDRFLDEDREQTEMLLEELGL
ncbi:putative tricarboxylic transport membrane protein [Brevibacterium sp. Mu109]|uniref:Bug family tripartite tricarboxylate transporter substrate binding protein n=1 Tax=Brevibacterium sp. Mu109 TaxID=1255669 RepID=UPI000C610E3D|nr:tripartite tricarboxylate transporter substrate-binding protein [Brevibacterium sp. Mu109]SMX83978.1 putative tricarboxylic transport membrane protein [Brevibacterium sp. Mu109]